MADRNNFGLKSAPGPERQFAAGNTGRSLDVVYTAAPDSLAVFARPARVALARKLAVIMHVVPACCE